MYKKKNGKGKFGTWIVWAGHILRPFIKSFGRVRIAQVEP